MVVMTWLKESWAANGDGADGKVLWIPTVAKPGIAEGRGELKKCKVKKKKGNNQITIVASKVSCHENVHNRLLSIKANTCISM